MSQTEMITLPAQGKTEYLFIFAHGVGSNKENLAPLAEALQQAFPSACCIVVDGFEPFDGGFGGRQWFSLQGVTEQNRPARVAAALPPFIDLIQTLQQQQGVDAAHTVLVGFSQGTIMSLGAVDARPALARAVLGFSGRYAELPQQGPQHTAIHLLHGEADPVIPYAQARAARDRLQALGAEVSLDSEPGTGHEISPALFKAACAQLRTTLTDPPAGY